MNLLPYRVCRDMDDDSAPVDYTFVASTSEAARLRQQQNIKRAQAGPALRHTAMPAMMDDGYGRGARPQPVSDAPTRDTVMKKLPSAEDGAPDVQSVAYPEAYGIPDNPFDPPPSPPRRASVGTRVVESGARDESVRRRSRRVEAPQAPDQPLVSQDGSQFEQPASIDVPEWLRVAQQNHLSAEERRVRAPRVQSAPPVKREEAPEPTLDPLGRPMRMAAADRRPANATPQRSRDYEEAGYPPELLQEQAQLERYQDEHGMRRRHGAQYAVNPYGPGEQAPGSQPAPDGYAPRGRATPMAARQGNAAAEPPRMSVAPSAQPNDALPPAAASFDGAPYAPGAEPYSRGQSYAAARGEPPAYQRRPSRETAYAPSATPTPSPDSPYQVITDERWQDEESDQMPAYEERPPVPWLAILMFVAAFIAVGLWLLQLTFTSQTEQVIRAREEVNQTLLNKHPYLYRELIEQYAEKNNLNPAFVAAIVLNESSFNSNAVSDVGARGLMQLMEGTSTWIYEKMGLTGGYSFDALFKEETNLEYGCWYLAFLCDRFRGDPVLVSAAYHAGQNTVQNWLNSSTYSADGLTIELENMMDGPTKQYATRVVRDYSIYLGLYYTEDKS